MCLWVIATTPQRTVLFSLYPQNRETCVLHPSQPGAHCFIPQDSISSLKKWTNTWPTTAKNLHQYLILQVFIQCPNVHFLLLDQMLQALFQGEGITHKQLMRYKIQSCQIKLVNQGQHLSGQKDGFRGWGCLFFLFFIWFLRWAFSFCSRLCFGLHNGLLFVEVLSKARHKANALQKSRKVSF